MNTDIRFNRFQPWLDGFDWNRCVAHNINNAMNVALGARFHIRGENQVSTNPVAHDFLKHARGLVAYFKRSGDRTERLSGVQLEMFEKVRKVLQDHHLRWNSTADMLDRLWKLKPAIQLYYATHDPDSEAQISVQEWHICAQCVGVCGPPCQATQSSQKSTALQSEVFGMIMNLKKSMEPSHPVIVPQAGHSLGSNGSAASGYLSVAHEDLLSVPKSIRELCYKELEERFCLKNMLSDKMCLNKILSATSNCLLKNKVRNMNTKLRKISQWIEEKTTKITI